MGGRGEGEGEGEVVKFCRGRSVHSSSIFSFWNARFKKFKIFLPVASSFSMFTFLDLRQIQNFKQILTLTLNLNFLFQGAVSFHPSVCTQNQPNPWNCFLFYPFSGFRGPSKLSSQLSQSIFCERKQTWQLLIKIKNEPFVNKQPGAQHEGEFWEGERWLAVSNW